MNRFQHPDISNNELNYVLSRLPVTLRKKLKVSLFDQFFFVLTTKLKKSELVLENHELCSLINFVNIDSYGLRTKFFDEYFFLNFDMIQISLRFHLKENFN